MQLSSPTTIQLGLIRSGKKGIWDTLKIMGGLVRAGKNSGAIRARAAAIVAPCSPKDWKCEAVTAHAWVQNNIRYLRDITDTETVTTPEKTLELGAGDCDDQSILLASLLESIGHPTRFVAIGFEPNIFSHVYVETLIGTVWVPLETTEPVEAGWSPDPLAIRAGPMYFYN